MTVIPWKRVWNGCICVSVYATQGIVCVPPHTTAFLFCHAFSFFMQPRKHDSEALSTTTSGFKRWNHSAVSQEVQLDFTQSLQCPPHCTLCFKVKLLPMIFWIVIINIILIINKSSPVEKKNVHHKFLEPSWCLWIIFFQSGCQFSKAEQKKKRKTAKLHICKAGISFFVSLMNLKSIIRTVADTFSQSEKSIYRTISANKNVLKALLFVPRTHFK